MEWTDAQITQLRTLWADGHSTAEIGRRMDIGKNAVVGKAHRLNLPSRKSPIVRDRGPDINARDQRIMDMIAQGVAQTVAATIAGVTRDVVQGVVLRARQSGRLPDRHVPAATLPPLPSLTAQPDTIVRAFTPGRRQPPVAPPETGPAIAVEAAPVRRAGVPAFTLPSKPCLWPIGEPKASNYRSCGADGVPGRPYCEAHCQVAYVNFDRGSFVCEAADAR